MLFMHIGSDKMKNGSVEACAQVTNLVQELNPQL